MSPINTGTVATSLALFVLVYFAVFSIGIYYMRKLIRRGPKGAAIQPATLPQGLPNRPLSLADHSTREARSERPLGDTRPPEPLT